MAKYNVLLVGCGDMANKWLEYIIERPDCEVLGLCDIIPEKARKMKEKNNLTCDVYDHIDKALIPNHKFNLAIDCTSPESHEQVVTAALRAGCDALGEKPMAVSREEALSEIKTADQSGKRYAVMQNRIYLPEMRSLRAAVRDGMIGRLGYVSSDFFIGAHFGGFRDAMDNPLVLDMAIHTFYQARFIIGSNPISVYCHEFNPPGSWYKGAASAVAIFEFKNGVTYSYQGSWCAEGLNTTWECDWRLCGELGSIKWADGDPPVAHITKPESEGFIRSHNEIKLPVDKYDYDGHTGCFMEMFAALDENRAAETDSHDNYFSMNMVYGAIESAKNQKKVYLD